MGLFEVFREMSEHDAAMAAAGVTPDDRADALTLYGLEQLERLAEDIPGMRLDRCGCCGGRLLIDTGTHRARCTAGCGWTGHVLRRLP